MKSVLIIVAILVVVIAGAAALVLKGSSADRYSIEYDSKSLYKGAKNSYKAGTAYYIGCRDTGELTDKLYEQILSNLSITVYDLPEGVTVTSREQYLFVQNFNDYAVTARIPGCYCNMETGEQYSGSVSLNAFDIAVLCQNDK